MADINLIDKIVGRAGRYIERHIDQGDNLKFKNYEYAFTAGFLAKQKSIKATEIFSQYLKYLDSLRIDMYQLEDLIVLT